MITPKHTLKHAQKRIQKIRQKMVWQRNVCKGIACVYSPALLMMARLALLLVIVFFPACAAPVPTEDDNAVLLVGGDGIGKTPDPVRPPLNAEIEPQETPELNVPGTPIVPTSPEELAIKKCVTNCLSKLAAKVDFSRGPCLHEAIIKDYACDIVHEPRIPSDDDPINTCRSAADGITSHVIELNPQCLLASVR